MDNLSNKISVKTLRITAILWFVALALSVGYCMGNVKKEVGMEVFDLMFTYDYAYATEFINSASAETIDFYRNVQIPVDFFLALMLGAFPIVCFLYMKKKINISNVFLMIALAITLLDTTENIMLFMILGDSISEGLVNTAGIITLVKNLAMYTTYLSLIFFTIKYKINKNKN